MSSSCISAIFCVKWYLVHVSLLYECVLWGPCCLRVQQRAPACYVESSDFRGVLVEDCCSGWGAELNNQRRCCRGVPWSQELLVPHVPWEQKAQMVIMSAWRVFVAGERLLRVCKWCVTVMVIVWKVSTWRWHHKTREWGRISEETETWLAGGYVVLSRWRSWLMTCCVKVKVAADDLGSETLGWILPCMCSFLKCWWWISITLSGLMSICNHQSVGVNIRKSNKKTVAWNLPCSTCMEG